MLGEGILTFYVKTVSFHVYPLRCHSFEAVWNIQAGRYKNCFWCKRQMPEELQPAKLEVAGSSPVSAANYGRVAQRIERVKISPLFVAQCTTPYGRMPLGLHSFLATNLNDPN